MNEKKKHHYVPEAYLKFFKNKEGKICIYRKDSPEKEIFMTPENTAFHKYYYSQPIPSGGRDNILEDSFGKLEEKWPPLVDKLINKDNINSDLETLFNFTILQRVRVPAARDAFEKSYAEMVRATAMQLKKQGELPSSSASLPEEIIDTMLISIDPHKSIHSMVEAIKPIGELFGKMGFVALHNKTDIDFITSDNPVIWFDPTVPPNKLQPYRLRPEGPVILFFPISPKVLLVGDTRKKEDFSELGLEHFDLAKTNFVRTVNREVVRFSYDAVFAQSDTVRSLVGKYADISPVVDVTHIDIGKGTLMLHQSTFGKRTRKPKWEGNN